MSKDQKKNPRSNAVSQALFNECREWDRCRIKSKPFVESEVTDRRGRVVRARGVEEMIKIWKRRLSKSGIVEKYREGRHFEKPSDGRRRSRQERDYKIEKANERRKDMDEKLRRGE